MINVMRSVLLILLFLPLTLHSNEPFVEVYKTHDNGLYGRSEERDIVLTVKESVFRRHETIEVDEEYNFLTAVVVDHKTVESINSQISDGGSKQFGFVKISRESEVFTIEDDNLFLNFSFSFHRPDQEILNIIEDHYETLPSIRESVLNHYKMNYVVKVHSAENLLLSEAREINYDEVMIMATIIGDRDQWLWGIHDGRAYLQNLLFN